MEVINLGKKNTIFNHFISEIRDVQTQKDRMRFRKNIERIGEIFSYEISKRMTYVEKEVITPLGKSKENLMIEKPVLATILRAGLPLHRGMLSYFDDSQSAFISAYRKHNDKNDFQINIEYMSSPNLDNKTVILCDPMLASGASMVMSVDALLTKGTPKHIHIVVVIASSQGIKYLQENVSADNCTLWIGAEDPKMTAQSYIVPGIGDAGDLAFGEKVDDL